VNIIHTKETRWRLGQFTPLW